MRLGLAWLALRSAEVGDFLFESVGQLHANWPSKLAHPHACAHTHTYTWQPDSGLEVRGQHSGSVPNAMTA